MVRRRVFAARPAAGGDLAAAARLIEILRAAARRAQAPGEGAGQGAGSPTSGFE
jgi:hypothetical protein